jgi:ribosomal protein S18 acetylase RimI-like enzyme
VLDGVARERCWLAFLEAPPLSRVRSFVHNGLRNGMAHFVAVDDGRVVGWCDVNPKIHAALRHSGVLGMGVAASHRRRGVGSALLGTTLEAAAAKGLWRIELVVRADNAAAIALYERHGFELEGRLQDYLIVDGRAYDALQMARRTGRTAGKTVSGLQDLQDPQDPQSSKSGR